MRLMASEPLAATSASRPSDSTVSLSMEARDSLSSTMSRRFMDECRMQNAKCRMCATRSALCILHSAFATSQSEIGSYPRQQRPLLLLHRFLHQRLQMIPPLHHLRGDDF